MTTWRVGDDRGGGGGDDRWDGRGKWGCLTTMEMVAAIREEFPSVRPTLPCRGERGGEGPILPTLIKCDNFSVTRNLKTATPMAKICRIVTSYRSPNLLSRNHKLRNWFMPSFNYS